MTDRGFYFRWLFGGLVVLLIIAGACYLWYHYDTAPYRREAAKTEEFARQWEKDRQAKLKTTVEQAAEKAPAESDTPQNAEKPKAGAAAMTDTSIGETKKAVTAAMQETENTEEVPISPHGFGPFPKVPPDYPGGDDPKFWTYDWGRNGELMARVCIKLWKQGKTTHGSTMSNGLVYPTFPNTIIVEWQTQQTPFGPRRYARRTSWCPEAKGFQQQMKGKAIYEGDFPSHFKIVERKDAGIDPYAYLDLPR